MKKPNEIQNLLTQEELLFLEEALIETAPAKYGNDFAFNLSVKLQHMQHALDGCKHYACRLDDHYIEAMRLVQE
jgi:hypothetical protein